MKRWKHRILLKLTKKISKELKECRTIGFKTDSWEAGREKALNDVLIWIGNLYLTGDIE